MYGARGVVSKPLERTMPGALGVTTSTVAPSAGYRRVTSRGQESMGGRRRDPKGGGVCNTSMADPCPGDGRRISEADLPCGPLQPVPQCGQGRGNTGCVQLFPGTTHTQLGQDVQGEDLQNGGREHEKSLSVFLGVCPSVSKPPRNRGNANGSE